MGRPTKGTKALQEQWVTRKEIARILGVSGVTVDNYRKMSHNPIPCNATVTPKKYPTSASVRWFAEYHVFLASKQGPGLTTTEANRRLKMAQAELAELEVARERDITCTVEEAANRMNKVCSAFVAALGGLPGKYAHEFVALPDEVHAQQALKQMANKARAELAELYGIEEEE